MVRNVKLAAIPLGSVLLQSVGFLNEGAVFVVKVPNPNVFSFETAHIGQN
jgi:hypothetical protein